MFRVKGVYGSLRCSGRLVFGEFREGRILGSLGSLVFRELREVGV